MGIVADFEKELTKRAKHPYAQWQKIDLHNHSPTSRDYRGKKNTASERTIQRIRDTHLSVVMFTDHEKLPDPSFTEAVRHGTGALILRGVELNVFVDAWDTPKEKVSKNLFFHLLLGFDPDGPRSPDYWVGHIYRTCVDETKDSGGTPVRGIRASITQLYDTIREAGALIIPAHLHSTPDAFKSRSIDDIYTDPIFLHHADAHFTALEVTSLNTAGFFDGRHAETGNLYKTCIRSSDSHEPEELGTRTTFVQMQDVSFAELKAALELPFRTTLSEPTEPPSYVAGLHIQGEFFKDLWLTLSPHCNVLMGVKGSGKTSVLECIRYVLGVEVPVTRYDTVKSHLDRILGPAGKIRALIKRTDGAKILVERSLAESRFHVTFEDDRFETFDTSEPLGFPVYILGWHEIEQAATDTNIRRLYMDTIAGLEQVRRFEEKASAIAKEIRQKHDQAASKYGHLVSLQKQVNRLGQLRSGLQQLNDAKLVQLKEDFEKATQAHEQFGDIKSKLASAQSERKERLKDLLSGIEQGTLTVDSPLEPAVVRAKNEIVKLQDLISGFDDKFDGALTIAIQNVEGAADHGKELFDDFVKNYDHKVNALSEEQRKLLDSHRKVMEETKELPRLEIEKDQAQEETEELLRLLVAQCGDVARILDERTKLRQESVEEFNREIEEYGVKLSVTPYAVKNEFQELSQRYGKGAEIVNQLAQAHTGTPRMHARLQLEYQHLLGHLLGGKTLVFDYAEFGHFIGVFEEDDLQIVFRVKPEGDQYTPIDQLSAGQRCTAVFPVLLKQREGPLVIDQPEDNLDNRHIADKIAPAVLDDKRTRQMFFTSHNANLVVLSDAEQIVAFEGTGEHGEIEAKGFLSTSQSQITRHVLEILDGGERALEMRYRKYGTRRA